jgi:hypothetical protein
MSNNDSHLQIADVGAKVDGKTISQWSQEWLKWAFHQPASHPAAAPLGTFTAPALPANAAVDNHPPVFFLYGGDWPNSTVPSIPTIDIKDGNAVLIPVVNVFDIESGDNNIASIPEFVAEGRGTYADEARYVAHLAADQISDAFLTISKNGRTLVNLHPDDLKKYSVETGTFALGNPQTSPLDYIGDVLTNFGVSLNQHDFKFTDEIGQWAMITGLQKGDYTVHFGAHIGAVVDTSPVTGKVTTILSAVIHDTTEVLHVG